MIKNITFSGLKTDTPDYAANDGQLAFSLGLIAEDGALRPIMPPKILFRLPEGYTAIYIHQTALFRYYIVKDSDGNVAFTDAEEPLTLRHMASIKDDGMRAVTSIGNTLVFLTDKGLRYFLWKSDEEGYLDLGSHMPELPLSFGLQTICTKSEDFEINVDGMPIITMGGQWEEWPEDEDGISIRRDMTSAVMAKVNKFIAEEATGKGRFIFPFLVRYAYRLFDESLVMHSAPVLMVAASGQTPEVIVRNDTSGKIPINGPIIAGVCAPLHQIDCAVIGEESIETIKNWKDIIRSVDIFISAPVYTFDQDGECKRFLPPEISGQQFAVCKHNNQAVSQQDYPLRHQLRSFRELYAFTFFPNEPGKTYPTIELPVKADEDIYEDIQSTAQFYLLHKFSLDELTTQRRPVYIPDDYLQSLTARELMSDDFDSHDQLIPTYAFPYNARLNIANLNKTLHAPSSTAALVTFTDGYIAHFADGSEPDSQDGTHFYHIYFLIRQDGRQITVEAPAAALAAGYTNRAPFFYLYYPNANAYKAIIQHDDGYISHFYEVDLKPHDFLSGAYAFDGFYNTVKTSTQPLVSSVAERTVSLPNRIYTSEVNNPFLFPVGGINDVGTGEILGIRSAAKALSEGQFGQFPLYAFTTDGVWALEVGSDGTYTARQPITRDVCISPDSITQTDSAVLFATARGVILISGSQTECITDALRDNGIPFTLDRLPCLEGLLRAFARLTGQTLTTTQVHTVPWNDFLQGLRILYDYPHRRVILYNPGVSYAYVYSARSGLWGMMPSRLTSTLNAWPDPIAVSEREVLDFSDDGLGQVDALLLTRPFTLSEPDVLKTIDTIIQRGYFQAGHVAQILYGSRDLYGWHIIASSASERLTGFVGTPYKAFRLVLICRFDKQESISECTVQFTTRLTNKPR